MIATEETRLTTIEQVSKGQWIRLVDVFFLGPLMIYAGSRKKLGTPVDALLIFFGVTTIYYNAQNYLINRQKDKAVV
jgi:hypothetical protein